MSISTGLKIGIGVAATAVVAGGLIAATRNSRDDDGHDAITSPGDDPVGDPNYPTVPGGGTSPGDEPLQMPVRGRVDPPGAFDTYAVDGSLVRDRLDATLNRPGWGNDVRITGRVDHGSWQTKVDPDGLFNETSVSGRRTSDGYTGTVDPPGLWNDVTHTIRETVSGAQVVREGRFDETWTPSWSEATWRSEPLDTFGGQRRLTFDPPGWWNDTKVTLDGNLPAGVEASIAASLFGDWKAEQERQDDYPDVDPTYPDPSYPDPGYPAEPSYPDPSYPDPAGGTYPAGEPIYDDASAYPYS